MPPRGVKGAKNKRIAAATVNKRRRQKGQTKSSRKKR